MKLTRTELVEMIKEELDQIPLNEGWDPRTWDIPYIEPSSWPGKVAKNVILPVAEPVYDAVKYHSKLPLNTARGIADMAASIPKGLGWWADRLGLEPEDALELIKRRGSGALGFLLDVEEAH